MGSFIHFGLQFGSVKFGAGAEFMSARLNMVRFQKVEGHTGVEGNERADQLAKAALEQI